MPNPLKTGRDDWIRTSGPLLPKQVRYQAALHPANGFYSLLPEICQQVIMPEAPISSEYPDEHYLFVSGSNRDREYNQSG